MPILYWRNWAYALSVAGIGTNAGGSMAGKIWFSSAKLAELSPVLQIEGFPSTRQGIDRLAVVEGWVPLRDVPASGRRGKRREYHLNALPEQVRAAIVLYYNDEDERPRPEPESGQEELWAWYARRPEKIKDAAKVRLAALDAWEDVVRAGVKKTPAAALVAKEHNVAKSALYRWRKRVKAHPRQSWLPLLCPRYAGRQKVAACSEEAWETWKADYLRRAQPTAQACYNRLLRTAADRGWKVPSLPSLKRRLTREISPQAVVLARSGPDAVKRMYPAQERNRHVFAAMEAVNGDGWTSRIWVKFPSGNLAKPCIWFWQDIYSSKWLAWRIDETENKDLLRLAYGDLVESYGIPRYAWIDNTMAAANKWLTGRTPNRFRHKIKDEDPLGIMPQVGTEVRWTTPGHGQSKPIERTFGIGGAGEVIDKHPRFDGRGTKKKPIPYDEFFRLVSSEIAAFNALQGRRGATVQGRSFDDVFEESYISTAPKMPTSEQRRLWLMAAEGVRVNRLDASIRLFSGPQGENRYWHEKLAPYAARKIVVRFDPQELHAPVYCYALDGRFICEAACILAAGFTDAAAAREHARLRAQHRKAAKQELKREKRMSALEVAENLPDMEPVEIPETKVVRPVWDTLIKRPSLLDGPAAGEDKEIPQENTAAEIVRPIFSQIVGSSVDAGAVVEDDEEILEDEAGDAFSRGVGLLSPRKGGLL
jgi:putative transposase